jgi:ribosome-associated protein
MRNSTGAASRSEPRAMPEAKQEGSDRLLTTALNSLSDAKAEEVITINLEGKTSIGDYMVIASGRSPRHVNAVADQLMDRMKGEGVQNLRVEGIPNCDWVLVDCGDIIVHIFRPEVRQFYNLEKMWSGNRPSDPSAA